MIFSPTGLLGSYLIDLEPREDERGWFARYYCKDEFRRIGHDKGWVQMNHSFTINKGAIRGLHFQVAPYSEVKLVRCIAGRVFDVIVDIRRDSSSFLQWVGAELSSQNKKMFYIPEGFAHGFQCLEPNCELLYHHSAVYKPGSEGGIRYDDPRVGIIWPEKLTSLSARDEQHPFLSENFNGI